MNIALTKQLALFEASLKTATDFVSKYGEKLPEGIGSLSIERWDSNTPQYTVYLHGRVTSDSSRALALLGDVFSRTGWTAKMSHSRDGFDWMKTVDGVEVVIYGAEAMPPPPPSYEVPASKFPIQIEDAK